MTATETATRYTLVDPCSPIPGVPPFAMWYVLDDRGEAVYCHPDLATAISGLLGFQTGTVDNRAACRANATQILSHELRVMAEVDADYAAAPAAPARAVASLAGAAARTRSAPPARSGVLRTLFRRIVSHLGVLVWFRHGKPVIRPYLRFFIRLRP